MRKLTHALLLWGSLSVFTGCSADPDSLGAKGDGQQPGRTECTGPNPSTLGCESGCSSGMVCDPDACHPSTCGCDEATGNWTCTADCLPNTCVPETDPPRCEGPNPAAGCDNGCPEGAVCDRDACRPSACGCDPDTGRWNCTADCGSGGACVPDPSDQCRAPDPSLGCEQGCPSGTVCDRDACRPAACDCDPVSGTWRCTEDCGSGGACVPDSPPLECQGPNPSGGCDAGCPSGTVCDPNACRSSACGCDRETGHWQCTADCAPGGACVPQRHP